MSVKDQPIRHALISVADKTGIIEFAQQLRSYGITILATGNTAKTLRQHQVDVTEVSDYTEFPEIMGGRVKTLHPKIHGGILARREIDEPVLKEHGMEFIDLVVINLYPFAKTIQEPDCTLEQAIEQIDVGGPAMLRAAAKNHAAVTVVIDHHDYATVLREIEEFHGKVSFKTRQQLAQKAFAFTAQYDALIAQYLSQHLESTPAVAQDEQMPQVLCVDLQKSQDLRYGENPQQAAAFYTSAANLHQIPWALKQGKPLSFNNLVDADVAWNCVNSLLPDTGCVIVKHANPCGVAIAEDLLTAYQRAYATDKTSAFGGIIAFNKTVDSATCTTLLAQQFVEVIIAPHFTREVLELLAKKPNIRALSMSKDFPNHFPYDIKCLSTGILVQQLDLAVLNPAECEVVTRRAPSDAEWRDLSFAWQVVKWVKSNAIVYAKEQQTIGIGAGQTSRICSAEIGILKAQEAGFSTTGAVVASDAFYPFRDSVDKAAEAGVTAIIQPGGSVRDEEVIAAADQHQLAMIFTHTRHFRH